MVEERFVNRMSCSTVHLFANLLSEEHLQGKPQGELFVCTVMMQNFISSPLTRVCCVKTERSLSPEHLSGRLFRLLFLLLGRDPLLLRVGLVPVLDSACEVVRTEAEQVSGLRLTTKHLKNLKKS